MGQSAEISAITGGIKEELEVNVFPRVFNTTLGGDTPIPRSVFPSYGMTILENETIAVAKNLVLMATGQEKRFAWKDLINTAGQSILNVTVDNALGVTNNEPNLLAALLNTELGAVISSAVYKNTIDPWQAAGEAFGMTAGQTLIASQRVYVHKKEIAQQKKRDQEEFKKEIASSMEIAFTEALQEMDMDPTFLAGKYFTGSVSNHKKPSIGFWGQPLDGIKHRPSKSDQDRNRQHREVIDQTSQQAHQHHDTDLSYAQYVQQNSVEGMWHAQMNQMSEEAFIEDQFAREYSKNLKAQLAHQAQGESVDPLLVGLDVATDIIPGLPVIKGSYELITGYNPITGEPVSSLQAGLETGSGLLPEVGGILKVGFFAATAVKVGKGVEKGLVGVKGSSEAKTILQPGIYELNPKDIGFSQANVGAYFNNGKGIDDLVTKLKQGLISAGDLPPIQVVQKNEKLFSIDNRRLLAFNMAGIDKIPVEVVSLKESNVAFRLDYRFDPILGEGNYAVVVNKTNRSKALDLLYEYNMIEGIHFGK